MIRYLFVLPFFVFFCPNYWQNCFVSPFFVFFCFLFFFVPMILIYSQREYRNPYFVLPFMISFVLSSYSSLYIIFLKNYILFLGVTAIIFIIEKCENQLPLLEWRLYLTKWFIDVFEAYQFSRIIVLILPVFLILFWIVSIFYP